MTDILLLDTINKYWLSLGINLKKPMGYLSTIYRIIAFCIILIVMSLGFMIMFFGDFDLNAFADMFENCGPAYQITSKVIINALSIGLIRNLLKSIEEKFWPINKFGQNVQNRLLKYYNFIKFVFKMHCYIMITCAIIICSKPLFLEKRSYPLASYNVVDTSNTPYYILIYSIHVFGLVYGVCFLLSVDGLFALFVLNIVCQVVMIKHGFRYLNMTDVKSDSQEKECYEKIKKLVDHHNVILEFCEKLNRLYSIQMFNQFLGNTASICMGIYIISAPNVEISSQIRASFILVTFVLEIAIYCIGGTVLTEICFQVADSMYKSGWENTTSKKLRFAVFMVVMRSQKMQSIQAGGLFHINVVTLVSILQSSFSFFTLMRNAQDNN